MSLAFPLLSAGVGGLAGWAACWIVDRATLIQKRMQAVMSSISSALLLAALSLKYPTPGTIWFVYGALVLVLVAVTVFDIRKHQIPHLVTIPGMILGLLVGSFVLPLGARQSILGFVVGGGVLLGATIVEAVRKKEIGGGDWKYAAMIGSFIGPQRIIVALILTGVFGALGAIALGLTGNHSRPQALGPWLSAGAVASILLG